MKSSVLNETTMVAFGQEVRIPGLNPRSTSRRTFRLEKFAYQTRTCPGPAGIGKSSNSTKLS